MASTIQIMIVRVLPCTYIVKTKNETLMHVFSRNGKGKINMLIFLFLYILIFLQMQNSMLILPLIYWWINVHLNFLSIGNHWHLSVPCGERTKIKQSRNNQYKLVLEDCLDYCIDNHTNWPTWKELVDWWGNVYSILV